MELTNFSNIPLTSLPDELWGEYNHAIKERGSLDESDKIKKTVLKVFGKFQAIQSKDINSLKKIQIKVAHLIDDQKLGFLSKAFLIKALFYMFKGHDNYIHIQEFVSNHTDEKGETLLHQAVKNNDLSSLKLLLESGADPNIPNLEGGTPLHYAVLSDQKAFSFLAEILLKYNADINAKDELGWTALHIGAFLGKLEVVKFLLKKKAKIDSLTYAGFTPAMSALGGGFPNIAALLQKDLDPEHSAWLDHKLLNHRFGLSITVKHEGQTIKLYGFRLYIPYMALLKSVSSSWETWIQEAPADWTDSDTQAILRILEQSCNLLDNSRGNLANKVDTILKAYEDDEVIVIPISAKEHANTTILYQNFFIKGDRNHYYPGIEIYSIDSTEKLKEIIFGLLSKKLTLRDPSINKQLGLKFQFESKHQIQRGAVCTWASSAKLSFQGAILAHLLKKGMETNEAEEYSLNMYHAWVKEDRIVAVEDYIEHVPESEVKKTVLACIYEHLSEKRARKQQPDPVMTLIENKAKEAVVLSRRVKHHRRTPSAGVISSIESTG